MFGIVFIIAAVAVLGVIIVAGVGAVKTSKNKAEEHSARMAEYSAKDVRYQDQHEEHEWKRADRNTSLQEKEIEVKLNEVRLQKEIAQKEQEILKLQKELQYKKDHPEKFSEWHPEDED